MSGKGTHTRPIVLEIVFKEFNTFLEKEPCDNCDKDLIHYKKYGESMAKRWFRYCTEPSHWASEECWLRNLEGEQGLDKLSLIYQNGNLSPGEDNPNRLAHKAAIKKLNMFIKKGFQY